MDFREIDGWMSWRVLFGLLFRVMVRAHFARLTAGFCSTRSSGGAFGAGVQALLSGVYAGVNLCF